MLTSNRGTIKGILTWTRRGVKMGSMGVVVVSGHHAPAYAEFAYSVAKIPITYRVNLVALPSNLGKGQIWYFTCPVTGVRCRKLHLVGSYLFHRSAFQGVIYELQTWSKKTRSEAKLPAYRNLFIDRVISEAYSKRLRKTYRNKLTKRYLGFVKRLDKLGVDEGQW